MEYNNCFQDDGLFIEQKVFDFSIEESIDSLSSLFHTIKQYREYANPDEDTWFEYITEFFNTLGLSTIKIAPRLIRLHAFDTEKNPKAIVCMVGPKESFLEIAYGISWESYLFFAAKYYKTDWVILTNGLQFKVLNFSNEVINGNSFQCELDQIIKQGTITNFFTLFKVITIITRNTNNDQLSKITKKVKGGRILVERHYLRQEFWTQLVNNPKTKLTVFINKKNPGVESYLNAKTSKKGIFYTYIITEENARIQMYIDKVDKDWNKKTFDSLFKNKNEVEQKIGNALVWDRLDNNRASLIRYTIEGLGLRDKEKWSELQENMIDTMIRFEKVFSPFIAQIEE
jgi:hypothetical protein